MLNAIFGAHVFGDSSAPARAAEAVTEAAQHLVSRIDIKQAIDSHVHWRQRLEAMIRNADHEPLDVAGIAASDRCELGRWLHGDGHGSYGHLPLFSDLVAEHAQLHARSGGIVTLARQGQRERALSELGGVEFSRTVARLKSLLAKVYVEVLSAENGGV